MRIQALFLEVTIKQQLVRPHDKLSVIKESKSSMYLQTKIAPLSLMKFIRYLVTFGEK